VMLYGLALGIWFSVGLVAMLFIHEIGHVIALRRKHLPTALPVFIPFLGAAIFAPNLGDRATEAYVGYGGPLVGSIAAIACFGLWAVSGGTSDLLLVISYAGVYINLLNLLPISPLDGGRICQAIGGWFTYIGIALTGFLVVESGEAGMMILLIIMLDSLVFSSFGRRSLIAIYLWVAMLILFTAGYRSEFVWVDVLDATFGAAITASYMWRDWSLALAEFKIYERFRRHVTDADLPPVPRDWFQRLRFAAQLNVTDSFDGATQRIMPPVRTRLYWLMAYLGLVLVLGVTVAVETAYLPRHMQPAAVD
jgi:Zn-dependent protease